MLVCWRNWAGDTLLILRNDFSIHSMSRLG